jgi:hypothetical protein
MISRVNLEESLAAGFEVEERAWDRYCMAFLSGEVPERSRVSSAEAYIRDKRSGSITTLSTHLHF